MNRFKIKLHVATMRNIVCKNLVLFFQADFVSARSLPPHPPNPPTPPPPSLPPKEKENGRP